MGRTKPPPLPVTERRRTILVVEDDASFAKVIASAVERGGFEPLIVYTARGARRTSAAVPLAAATIDIELPDGIGLDLIQELHARHPGIPIAVLTNFNTDDNANRTTELAAHFLAKRGHGRGLAAWLERVRTHAAVADEIIALVNEIADERGLPERMRDVLRLAVTALTRKQIANSLGISVSTVNATIARIESALGQNMTGIVEGLRAEAMSLARERPRGDA